MTSVMSSSVQHSGRENGASLNFKLNPDNTLALSSPPWMREVEDRINEILALTADWDGEGSVAPDAMCALNVVNFLLGVALHETPAPAITPTSGGGMSVEWHVGGYDLEVKFSSDGTRSYFYVEPDGTEAEGDAGRDEDAVARWVSELPVRDTRKAREL